MGNYYTYILFDSFGIPRYVGKGKNNRWLDHDRGDDPINKAKNKFIKQTMKILGEVPKIKFGENLTEAEAFELETLLILAIGRIPNGPLANLTDGGCGLTMTPEICQKISLTLTGRKRPPEVGLKVSQKLKGRKRLKSEIEASKISLIKFFADPIHRQERVEFLRTNEK